MTSLHLSPFASTLTTSSSSFFFLQTPETTPYIISEDGCQIRRVESVKYLDLIVDDTLTWAEHVDYISAKIVKTLELSKG